MQSCGMSVIKYLLFIFNVVFAISGLIILISGAVVLSESTGLSQFGDENNYAASIILIVAGAIVFIVAFLGCFGAIRESYAMLIAFSVCLLVIFIIELAAGIAAAVSKNELSSEKLQASLSQYSSNENEKAAWDKIQSKLMCCGLKGPSDWGSQPPQSCCKEKGETNENPSPYCTSEKTKTYLTQVGCFEKISAGVKQSAKLLIGIGIGIACIELIGIVLACWLAFVIKRENEGEETK